MSKFYLAKSEEHFLGKFFTHYQLGFLYTFFKGYVSYFLLDSINSEEYEKELFEHPLEDCNFEEYKLQTNWR